MASLDLAVPGGRATWVFVMQMSLLPRKDAGAGAWLPGRPCLVFSRSLDRF